MAEIARWLRWRHGLPHWTDDELAAARHVIDAAEIAGLGDADGAATQIADGSSDLQLMASAAVWLLVSELTHVSDTDLGPLVVELATPDRPGRTETELVGQRARAEVVGLAVDVLKLLTVPVADLDGGEYVTLCTLETPYPLHTSAVAYLLAQMYQSHPVALATLREQFVRPTPPTRK
ncbi:hypothetical protein A5670_26410 [Mycolicibacterium fortuitum]|nr:hypothetical protein A5670_26410 [Mycolicibacterium fortuitum]